MTEVIVTVAAGLAVIFAVGVLMLRHAANQAAAEAAAATDLPVCETEEECECENGGRPFGDL